MPSRIERQRTVKTSLTVLSLCWAAAGHTRPGGEGVVQLPVGEDDGVRRHLRLVPDEGAARVPEAELRPGDQAEDDPVEGAQVGGGRRRRGGLRAGQAGAAALRRAAAEPADVAEGAVHQEHNRSLVVIDRPLLTLPELRCSRGRVARLASDKPAVIPVFRFAVCFD